MRLDQALGAYGETFTKYFVGTYNVVEAIAGGQADVSELGLQQRWHHAAVLSRCGPDESRGDEKGEGEVVHFAEAKVEFLWGKSKLGDSLTPEFLTYVQLTSSLMND